MDFPPPVGNRASVSFPSITELIISSCIGRKDEYPQYFNNVLLMVLILYENIKNYAEMFHCWIDK